MTVLIAAWGLFIRFMRVMGIPMWLPVAGIAGLLALGGAYWKGHHDAAQACQEAALRTKIASLERDLAAEAAARTLEAAWTAQLEDQRQILNEKVADYEAALKSRPEPQCALSPDDVRALDGLHRKRK